jgi:ABC-2 type transport system ATP-binding protein
VIHQIPVPGETAVEAVGLGKRYRRGWALRDCTFRLPAGKVCALVGPNGAGKSTLLSLLAHLREPSAGTIRVFGADPADDGARRRIAFLAQDKPLYPNFTVDETLRLGRELNPGWDQATALRILGDAAIPLTARVKTLSGGQRTRVALALALGKRAELLLMDEPMADLDPLMRLELLGALMAEAAEYGTTMVISSHILAELSEACDYVLLVNGGHVRLAGEVEDLKARHVTVVGVQDENESGTPVELTGHTVVEKRVTGRQYTALIRPDGPVRGRCEVLEPTLEDMLLTYLRVPDAPSLLTPSAVPVGHALVGEVAA